MSSLQRVREAIEEVWGNSISSDMQRTRKIIKDATYTGKNDPGGWSPSSEVVIHCESGIPNGLYSTRGIENWERVSDLLGDLYCEHINGAVIAVYEA